MKRILGLLLAVLLVFSITIPTNSVSVHADSPIGYVTMSVEANTLGAGLIRQPVKVPFYEGESYANVLDRFLSGTSNYDSYGSFNSGFYLSKVKLENGNISINVPTVIKDAMNLSNEEIIANGAQKTGYLGEFDYYNMSGWMYAVNNEFPNVGASDKFPKDGDVCRWQFTLYGYGSDLGQDNSSFGGDKALYTPANKDSLLKKVAEVNSAPNKDALLAKESIRTAYDQANTALINLTVDQSTVNTALTTLNDALNNVDISTQLNDSLGYILTKVPNPSFGTGSGEWSVLSLARGNYSVPDQYFVNYYNRIVDTVKSANGVLSTSKNTEYARLILALSALGKDSTDVGGYNLLTPLADYDKTVSQGINGGIFALIAFDSNNYQIPTIADSTKQATREKYVNYILSKEVKKGTDQAGGFALFGTTPDPDITSMALQALAPYQSMPEVNATINRALKAISTIQKADGGFTAFGSTSSESISQVIVALTAVGVNPATDSRFVKENGNLVTALLRFYANGGGFKHVLTGNVDGMATDQATYALVSYDRFLKGENSLYNMMDAPVTLVTNQINALPTTITISNESEIAKARTAYEGLTAAQQGLLSSAVLDKLVAAESEITSLKEEAVLVDSVINKINELPASITLSDETAVVSAREAYDGLTQAQKEKVSETVLNKLISAEAEISSLKEEASLIDSVIVKIKAIPTTISLSDEAAVVSAREAYDGLTQAQKEKVTETVLEKLVTAESEIKSLKDEASLIDSVVNKINALPTSVTLSDETAVISAREAYNGLTLVQKGKVSTTVLNKLEAAENKIIVLKDQVKADAVQNKINGLPSQIKLANESAVIAARKDYNSLTTAQKNLVTTTVLNKLVLAEKTIVNLKNAAKVAKDKIATLPTTSQVRLTSESAIKSARAAYNSLDSSQKSLVGSITRLTSAESRLGVIKADKTLPTIKGISNNAYYRTKKTIQISDNVGLLNVKLTFNGKSYTYYSGKVFAASGKYNIIATDLKGNKRSIVFYIDNKAPLKPAVKSIKSSTTKVTGKAESNSTVYIYRGSKRIGSAKVSSSGTYSVKISKQKKRTKLTVYVVDRAGNKGAKTTVTVK
ncbi:hypothetical protein CN692_00420 [Bacillus sp. AFS002410]|uniref:Ig-like domain-containing protein n=1 Tax=Bacillus sp. AFS002410 TaxID=2033481 RepID=UPI000BEFD3CA|nr:Ig-like domain-containing protein [Bacillus sp. AFS002410]PEJ60588.1 hypothetical protein CN692_00420 [Bacillus sp. AFS002410]